MKAQIALIGAAYLFSAGCCDTTCMDEAREDFCRGRKASILRASLILTERGCVSMANLSEVLDTRASDYCYAHHAGPSVRVSQIVLSIADAIRWTDAGACVDMQTAGDVSARMEALAEMQLNDSQEGE